MKQITTLLLFLSLVSCKTVYVKNDLLPVEIKGKPIDVNIKNTSININPPSSPIPVFLTNTQAGGFTVQPFATVLSSKNKSITPPDYNFIVITSINGKEPNNKYSFNLTIAPYTFDFFLSSQANGLNILINPGQTFSYGGSSNPPSDTYGAYYPAVYVAGFLYIKTLK